jgi:two-component system, NtrC family, response regulator PilR
MRILILDDDPSRRADLAALAARACPQAEVCRASGGEPPAGEPAAAVVLVGTRATDGPGGCELVARLRARWPESRLLVVSACDAATPAVAALQAGASDYLVFREGDDGAELVEAMARVARPARRAGAANGRASGEGLAGLVGASGAIEQVRELVRMAARTDAHVLIEGETGTGKEVVARAIHTLGRRASGPFVPVNCAAVPESLAESEFFGHARGAFTGALQERPGVLQLADRGTLFLDEVEDLPPALQAKLLRVVQDREVRPLGASTLRRVDIRLIAASNRDLWRMVEAGEFRRDLYYRLRVFSIPLPPLRERREDLRPLIEHFVARFNRTHSTEFRVPPDPALRSLFEHAWPGNVRELENTLESLCILASASGGDLADVLARPRGHGTGLVSDERTRILRVLDDHRWNRQRAAAALGISRVTLWRRMERHGIRDPLGAPVRETA